MGNYYFAQDGKNVFFKLTGTLKYTTSGHFDTFLDDFLSSEQDIDTIAIDLTEAEYLDSTNLGFLAKIAEYMMDRYNKKTLIYSTSSDINHTLSSVGFDEVFTLIFRKSDMDDKFGILDPSSLQQKDRTDMMIDAHKCLMRINEKNAQTFKDVVELMEMSRKK